MLQHTLRIPPSLTRKREAEQKSEFNLELKQENKQRRINSLFLVAGSLGYNFVSNIQQMEFIHLVNIRHEFITVSIGIDNPNYPKPSS